MTVLLLGAALLVGLSAGLKVRATSRLGMGISPFALAEGAASIGLGLLGLATLGGSTTPGRWIIPGAVVLLVVSSFDHARRLRFVRERREATEAGRLAAFLGRPGDSVGREEDL